MVTETLDDEMTGAIDQALTDEQEKVVSDVVDSAISDAQAPLTSQKVAAEDQSPEDEVKSEIVDKAVDKSKAGAAGSPAYNWREKAITQAQKLLKEKTDLTPQQIDDFIYERFIRSSNIIQDHVETIKERDTRLQSYESRQAEEKADFYDEAIKMPEFRALLAGGAKIVMNNAGDGEIVDEFGDPVAQSPTIRKFMAEFNSLKETLTAKERKEQEQQKAESQTKSQKEIAEAVDKDMNAVLKDPRFSQFKEWVDYYKSSKVMPLELREVMDIVRREQCSLVTAVKNYYIDNNLPLIQKKAESDTIDKLKLKAKKNTEGGTAPGISGRKSANTTDATALAEEMVRDLFGS